LPKFRIKSTRTIKTFSVLETTGFDKEIQYPDENLIEFLNNGIFDLHIFKIGIHWYSLAAQFGTINQFKMGFNKPQTSIQATFDQLNPSERIKRIVYNSKLYTKPNQQDGGIFTDTQYSIQFFNKEDDQIGFV